MGRIALVALLLVSMPSARADELKEREALRHFDAGRGLYAVGDYQAAVREFAAGYALSARPRFLIDLGHAYRKLGQLDRAREMYRRFLDEASGDEPERAGAKAALAEVERALEARPPDRPAPAENAHAGKASGEVAPARESVASAAGGRPLERRARWRWWLVVVAAALATVGAVVAIAVPARSNAPPATTLGDVTVQFGGPIPVRF
jgi:tetratricopeptide (TPR) repeat protein